MTHAWFVLPAYALAVALGGGLALDAWRRHARAGCANAGLRDR